MLVQFTLEIKRLKLKKSLYKRRCYSQFYGNATRFYWKYSCENRRFDRLAILIANGDNENHRTSSRVTYNHLFYPKRQDSMRNTISIAASSTIKRARNEAKLADGTRDLIGTTSRLYSFEKSNGAEVYALSSNNRSWSIARW